VERGLVGRREYKRVKTARDYGERSFERSGGVIEWWW